MKKINDKDKYYLVNKKWAQALILLMLVFSAGYVFAISGQQALTVFTSGTTISSTAVNNNFQYLENKSTVVFKAKLANAYTWQSGTEVVVDFDDHKVASSNYNAGVYTVPSSGIYRVTYNMIPDSGSGCLAYVSSAYQNGTALGASEKDDMGTNYNYYQYTFKAQAGDTIEVRAGYCASSDGDDADLDYSFLMIQKLI